MFRRIGLSKPSRTLSHATPVRCASNRTALSSRFIIRNDRYHSSEADAHHIAPPPPPPPPRSETGTITIWALAAVTTIYTTCAVIENLNLKNEMPKLNWHISLFSNDQDTIYDTRRKAYEIRHLPGLYPRTPWPDADQLFNLSGRQQFWDKLMPTEKLTYTIIAANIGIHALSGLLPTLWSNTFVHIPGMNRNFTLLTCVFGHNSLIHLGVNMYTLSSFLPMVGQDITFHSSIAHMAAFYLSTGVICSWAQALSVGLRPHMGAQPFLGASGVLFALVGAFAIQNPDAKMQIIFIPIDFEARQLLGAAMLFDCLGVLGTFKKLRLAHAAHLSGALLGLGYVYLDCERKIWQPLCQSVYKWFRMSKWEDRIK